MKKIKDKLDEIYSDIEANVTNIYQRRELHILYDLAWHSILQFEFKEQLITRGWVEVLVIGDTRCGKTKTAERMLRHYQAGELGTGENTSVAGLLGGMQQINRHWSIIWGKYPRNDGRLIIIDEASNLSTEAIANFATARSEGVARITKIQTEQTLSRTRAIWISNPRINRDGHSRSISAYDYGVGSIPELIGRQADVARFDAACVVANGEVDESVIFRGQISKDSPRHKFLSSRCHSLVMWAWSRKPEHVTILRETESEIFSCSKNLARKYHESIPLIKLEELPEKLARLSVALAARLFNSPDGINLVVRPEHVQFVSEFLESLYSRPNMGYDQYSKKLFEAESLPNSEEVIERVKPYGMELISGLLSYDIIRQNVLEDLTGLDRDQVRGLLSFLVRSRCLRPEHTWYRKSAPFIKLLKSIETGKIHFEYKEEY
jgi:hypothetical protein